MKRQMLLFLPLTGLLLSCACSGGKAAPAGGAAAIPDTQPERRYVAITFDDGPRPGTTDRLLDGLRDRGVNATFFLIGAQIEANKDLVSRMAEEGHQIGNHTWSHQRLEGASPEAIAQEIRRTEEALEEIAGPGPYWLRPPYGQVSPGDEAEIAVPMVKWSVDPRDWESRNADQVTRAILDAVQPNSIILLHDIYPSSVEAALRVIDRLREEGYWFVTVEELLELNGIVPQAGVIYRTGIG